MSKNLSPLEDVEQIAVVQYMELRGLKFSAVPNSTYTTSWKQKAKNKAMGLRAGIPDLLIIIRPDQAKDGRGRVIFLEMKRRVGGVVSPEQKAWIVALNTLGIEQVEAVVAHGSDEAIDYLADFLKPLSNSQIF